MSVIKDGEKETPVFVDKVERIYRVLLSRKLQRPSWYRIAKEADVAYGWTYRVLKGLETEGIINEKEIANPSALFTIWRSRPDKRIYREYNLQEPTTVLKDALDKGLPFAFTGYFAENLIGGYLFPSRHELYIKPENAGDWNSLVVEHGYVGKGNVQVIVADDHVFYEKKTISGWPVVSLQQIVVDLMREGAECAEAANILIERHYHG